MPASWVVVKIELTDGRVTEVAKIPARDRVDVPPISRSVFSIIDGRTMKIGKITKRGIRFNKTFRKIWINRILDELKELGREGFVKFHFDYVRK